MHIQSFLNYLEYEKRYSKHTVTAYSSDLAQFSIYIFDIFQITSINDVSHQHIRSWIVSLMENKMLSRSVNRKITTIKSYYKFLLKQNIVLASPMAKIQTPKMSKRLPVFVEEEKMNTLLEDIEFEEGFAGLRDKLIIEVFYLTGMRLSELINITEGDIDLHSCCIKVLGKRNKERVIPFTIGLRMLVEEYLKAKK